VKDTSAPEVVVARVLHHKPVLLVFVDDIWIGLAGAYQASFYVSMH
jgi:hypothetical protein